MEFFWTILLMEHSLHHPVVLSKLTWLGQGTSGGVQDCLYQPFDGNGIADVRSKTPQQSSSQQQVTRVEIVRKLCLFPGLRRLGHSGPDCSWTYLSREHIGAYITRTGLVWILCFNYRSTIRREAPHLSSFNILVS